jgi:hypothetical protein
MGVRFGVVAAKTSWDNLLAELSAFAGDFVDRGPVADIGEIDLRPPEGLIVVGGECHGSAFLLDTSMMLWSGGLDRFVESSGRLQCAVGLALGETVSGTYGLFAAERGVVRRVYFNCVSSIRQPFVLGEPFASEAEIPLEVIDGHGLWAALKSHGLDFESWHAEGSKRAYLYKDRERMPVAEGPRGPIDADLQRHCEQYRIPADQVPRTTVRRRRLPDGTTGWDIVPALPKQSLVARVLGLFSKKA